MESTWKHRRHFGLLEPPAWRAKLVKTTLDESGYSHIWFEVPPRFRWTPGEYLDFLVDTPEGYIERGISVASRATPSDASQDQILISVSRKHHPTPFVDYLLSNAPIVNIRGPYKGAFHVGLSRSIVFIAVECGICVFRAILEDPKFNFNNRATLLYYDRGHQFTEFFDRLKGRHPRFKVKYLKAHRQIDYEVQYQTQVNKNSMWFISGTARRNDEITARLQHCGIPDARMRVNNEVNEDHLARIG